jgi:hypothetical protein
MAAAVIVLPAIEEIKSDPFGFVICVELILKAVSVEAGPKLCRMRLEVDTEFEAASHEELIPFGTVMGVPMNSKNPGLFRIDLVGVNWILLMTFIEVPVVVAVVIALAVRI